jgi:hypothetical protein
VLQGGSPGTEPLYAKAGKREAGTRELITWVGTRANNLGRNARAHPKHTSAFGAEMCGVGGPISDASTGRANAL